MARLSVPYVLAWAVTLSTGAAAAEYAPEYLDADDPQHVDVDDSLDEPYPPVNGIRWRGDVRSGYFDTDVEQRDGTSDSSDEVALRVRYGADVGLGDAARVKARIAMVCTDSRCDPNPTFPATPANGTTIDAGDIVFDELYLDVFERGRFDVAAGRMQTRSVSRGGVFGTALTRLTSANVSVNWTDGIMARFISRGGWVSKLLAQYNDSDGSSTLARPPLNFDDDDSRVSWFYSLESTEPWGVITQRGFDITYLPSALATNDVSPAGEGEATDDYWALVGRAASAWPQASGSTVIVASQIGWAPETPSRRAVAIGDGGSADGWAWHIDASWMNFAPGHSIGVNYGHADAGWLLSTSYRPNEDALTLRYHWRPRSNIQLEVQGRWREEAERLTGAVQERETFDWRARLTWVLQAG